MSSITPPDPSSQRPSTAPATGGEGAAEDLAITEIARGALAADANACSPPPLTQTQTLSLQSISEFEELLQTEGTPQAELIAAYERLPKLLQDTIEGHIFLDEAQRRGAETIHDPEYGKHAVEQSIEVLYPIKWREKFTEVEGLSHLLYLLDREEKQPSEIRQAFERLNEDLKNQIYGYVYEEHALQRGKALCPDPVGELFGKSYIRQNLSLLKEPPLWKAAIRDSVIATAGKTDALQYRIGGGGLLNEMTLRGDFEWTEASFETACFLLSSGANISNSFLYCVIGYAIDENKFDALFTVAKLLKGNTSRLFIDYAFSIAAQCGREDLLEFLLNIVTPIHPKSLENALQQATGTGNLDIVRFLISKIPTITENGLRAAINSLFIYPKAENKLTIAELLLSDGRRISTENLIPFIGSAAKKGNLDLMKFLFSKIPVSSDTNHWIHEGIKSALWGAAEGERVSSLRREEGSSLPLTIAEYLLSEYRSTIQTIEAKTVIEASRNGNADLVRLLLSDDRETNDEGLQGAIEHAASQGDLPLVEFLLPKVSAVPLTHKWIDKAVIHALQSKHLPIVQLLLSRVPLTLEGDHPETMDGFPLDALHLPSSRSFYSSSLGEDLRTIAKSGHLRFMEFLLSKFNLIDNLFDDPYILRDLHLAFTDAAKNGHFSIVKLLLPKIPRLNEPSAKHVIEAAFSDAAEKGHLDIARFLLSKLESIGIRSLNYAIKIQSTPGPWSQADRIAFARRFAALNPDVIAAKIQKFGIDPSDIENQKALTSIAKICAEHNPLETRKNLTNFRLPREALMSIAILCAIKYVSELENLENYQRIFFSDINRASGNPEEERYFRCYKEGSSIRTFLQKEYEAFCASQEGDPIESRYPFHYLMALYVAIQMNPLPGPDADEAAPGAAEMNAGLEDTLYKILKIGSRPLQAFLTSVLANVGGNPSFENRFSSIQKVGNAGAESYTFARPILLPLANWFEQIPDRERPKFLDLKTRIQATLDTNHDAIKQAETGLNITCLKTLMALEASPLSAKEKLNLFTYICKKPPSQAELTAQTAADRQVQRGKEAEKKGKTKPQQEEIEARFQKQQTIKKESQARKKKEEVEHFEKGLKYLALLCETGFFADGLPADLRGEFTFEKLENVAMQQAKLALFGSDAISEELQSLLQERYLTFTEGQRRVFGLELYSTRIRSLRDTQLSQQMTRFVSGILTGSLHDDRYDVSLSPHLQQIEESSPGLLTKWKALAPHRALPPPETATSGVAGVTAGATAAEASRVHERESYQWLKDTLNTPGHFPIAVPDGIRSFLDDVSIFQDAEKLSDLLSSESPYLEMQKLCFTLCKEGITLAETKDILELLQKFVSEKPELQGSQWKRDIDDRIALLSLKQKEEAFEVSITDDWQDLFLCGTEVLGSCQRIDGSLGLNQCLLSYCLDGKIKLLAVKDANTGKIASRALLKLLLRKEGSEWVPVLFLERIYPSPCPPDHERSLNTLAIATANELKIELFTQNPGLPIKNLHSLGGPCPFEYEDALSVDGHPVGIARNQTYQFPASRVSGT